ncbi:MAG: HD domain-containing protein [bacterium]|nr:HD domain-containing protein [bacterium]
MENKEQVLNFFKEINYNSEDEKDGKNYRYYHPLRVLKLSERIIKSEVLQEKVSIGCTIILSLFHDIGKNKKLALEKRLFLDEHDKNNIVLFEEFIVPFIKNENDKDYVIKLIVDFSNKKFDLTESKIVHDADNLDEIGMLNFWRLAVYAGKHNQDIKEAIDYYFSFDRQDKIRKSGELFFKSSKNIAKERMEKMDKALIKFKEETFMDSIETS